MIQEDGLMVIKTPADKPHFGHPLELPIGKLRHASETLTEAERVWQDYVARTPATLETSRDHDHHAIVTVVRLAAPPPIDKLNALLRNCINDARSALDNLITRLAQDHGATGRQLRTAAFPVALTEPEWNRCLVRLAALPPDTVARVRCVQPFISPMLPGPPHPLALLHELWNADKHRGSFSAGIGFSPQGGESLLSTMTMTLDTEDLDRVVQRGSDVDEMIDLDLGPITDGTRVMVTRLPDEVSLDAVVVESVHVQVTLGLIGPGVSISDSAVALLKNALRYARETTRYVAGVTESAPVAFPPGLIELHQ